MELIVILSLAYFQNTAFLNVVKKKMKFFKLFFVTTQPIEIKGSFFRLRFYRLMLGKEFVQNPSRHPRRRDSVLPVSPGAE